MFIFDRGNRIGKTFTLKLIIQGLLRLYTRDISSDLTKIKALFMPSIGKISFNIDGLIIHLTLNILVQNLYLVYQTYQMPNSLNRLIC